jgi:hypothetical protein
MYRTVASATLLLLAVAFFGLPGRAADLPKVRIVLSFDDGPHAPLEGGPSTTLIIADILKHKALNGIADDLKAAFFVQTGIEYRGGSRFGLEVLGSLKNQGHIVGVHTGTVGGEEVDHLDHVERQRQGKLAEDLNLARSRLQEAGIEAKYVRPTFGHFDREVLETYRACALKVILWDADSKDNGEVRDAVAQNGRRPVNPQEVIQTLKGGRESVYQAILAGKRDLVVLFHDINPTTATHLRSYLQAIREVASEVAGDRYQVAFVRLAAEIESIFAAREDETDVAQTSSVVPPQAPTEEESRAGTLDAKFWIVIGCSLIMMGFAMGLPASWLLLRVHQRPMPAPVPQLPVPVLEVLARQTVLTGAQAACITDCLEKLGSEELARIERTLSGLQVPESGSDWDRFVHARLQEPLEVICPSCGTRQGGHWLRPILGCAHCQKRFLLRDSPAVRPSLNFHATGFA